MNAPSNCYLVKSTLSQGIKQKYDLLNLDSIFNMFHNFYHQYKQSSWKLREQAASLQIPLHLSSGVKTEMEETEHVWCMNQRVEEAWCETMQSL